MHKIIFNQNQIELLPLVKQFRKEFYLVGGTAIALHIGQLFSEKLFRAQLSYFDDIDFTEPVEFIGPSIDESEIKKFLTDIAIDLF